MHKISESPNIETNLRSMTWSRRQVKGGNVDWVYECVHYNGYNPHTNQETLIYHIVVGNYVICK